MGQYYMPVLLDGTDVIVYNRDVNGEYGMAKLMEHSWIGNPIVEKVSGYIYNHPCRLAWMGDYFEGFIPEIPISRGYAWSDECNSIELPNPPIDVHGKILINHSRKIYIPFNEYIEQNTKIDQYGEWCVHPLSILTACGNGMGGGDYRGENQSTVGEWAGDLLSIVDEKDWIKPEGYLSTIYEFSE